MEREKKHTQDGDTLPLNIVLLLLANDKFVSKDCCSSLDFIATLGIKSYYKVILLLCSENGTLPTH